MNAETFSQSIDKGDPGPLCFLYGDEPYLAERAVDRLLSRLLDPGFRDFNLDIFYGNEVKGEEVVAAANTLPMFAPHRIVLVKRASEMNAAALEYLAEYSRSPSPTTVLVMVGEKIDQRKKFFAELKKRDFLVEFKRPYENQLPAFIRQAAESQGKKMDGEAAAMLAALSGSGLRELASQVDKLCAFVGDRDRITARDVREAASDTRIDSVFEFPNALGTRDVARALRVLTTIIRDGESPIMLVGAIARHFRQLWSIRQLLAQRLPAADVQRRVGVAPFFYKGMAAQAVKFDNGEYRKIFQELHQADLSLKGGGDTAEGVMVRLVYAISGTEAGGGRQ
jgi:DNA polymerase-3 subunit delta